MRVPAARAETSPGAPSRRWLVPVMVLASCLGFARLGHRSLWLDEIFTYRFSTLPASDIWDVVSHREANMVLYYGLLRFWLQLGDSEAWMRSLSAILMVVATALVYELAARVYGPRAALFGAFFFAINPAVVAYAQEARGYALFLVLAVGATTLLVRALDGRPLGWPAYVVVAALAIYSHLFGALVVAAHAVALIAGGRPPGVPWRRMAAVAAGIAVLVSPLIVFVASAAGQLDWVSEPGVRELAGVFAFLAGGRWMLLVYGMLVVVGVVVAAWDWRTEDEDRRRWRASLILVSWLVVPVLVAFAISQIKPALVPRFFMTGVAPLVILAAAGVARIRSTAITAACLLLIVGLTVPRILEHYRGNPEDWRGAITQVAAHAHPQDAIVFYISTGQHAFAYYTRHDGGPAPPRVIAPQWSSLDDMKSQPEDLRVMEQGYPRVWLVLSHVESGLRGEVRQALEATLADRYRSIRSWEFPGVRVVAYEDLR